ncbi:MAG: hypothetical protein AAF722_08510 [Cyanobacteria bacterium P01_C01_bin.70]
MLGQLLQRGRHLLAPTPVTLRQRRVGFWFSLTLAYAVLLAVLTWATITEGPYHIPDDARQHVFWMQRFIDPALFASDWIADYFASVAPIGFVALYRSAFWLGLDPLTFNTILPSLLLILTAIAIFLVCLELCALPAAGFAASMLLGQSIEYTSSVASGTPKAFVWLLTALFWYGWLRRSRWLTWGSILLQGAFYPPTVLISAGVLALGLIERQPGGRWRWRRDRQLWALTIGGLAIATGIVLQYGLSANEFGPTVTLAAAFEMREFYASGRGAFFRPEVGDYLLQGRSGLQFHSAFTPLTNLLGLGLPVLLCFPQRFPLVAALRSDMGLLWRVMVTSLFWFTTAHLVLFRLHLPNRYVGRYFILVFVVLAALSLVIIADGLLQWALRMPTVAPSGQSWHPPALRGGASGLALLLFAVLLLYPLTYPNYPTTSLERGKAFELYEFLATQPKDLMLASLSTEANNIPSFAGRSVLVSAETAIPYHQGYYREIEQRSRDLIAAQFTTEPAVLHGFIQKYGVTHWLLDAYAYNPDFWAGNGWMQQYQPEAHQAVLSLRYGRIPVLATVSDRCDRFNHNDYRVLDASCIMAETSG